MLVPSSLTRTKDQKMSLLNTICQLAADRYNDARKYETGDRSEVSIVAACTESIMCSLQEDYSTVDEKEQTRVAEFIADGFGLSLSDVLA